MFTETVRIEEGDMVRVSNGATTLKERIFLSATADGGAICVHKADEALYEAGEYFRVGIWSVVEDCIPRYGDEVEVSNGGKVFTKRTFLGYVDGKVLVVFKGDQEKFESGAKNFRTATWNMIK